MKMIMKKVTMMMIGMITMMIRTYNDNDDGKGTRT